MALHRVVVPAQVSHEAQARQEEVVAVRLATAQKDSGACQKTRVPFRLCTFWFLHVCHKKCNQLVDVVCGLEDANVIRQFLQHLQTLDRRKQA